MLFVFNFKTSQVEKKLDNYASVHHHGGFYVKQPRWSGDVLPMTWPRLTILYTASDTVLGDWKPNGQCAFHMDVLSSESLNSCLGHWAGFLKFYIFEDIQPVIISLWDPAYSSIPFHSSSSGHKSQIKLN